MNQAAAPIPLQPPPGPAEIESTVLEACRAGDPRALRLFVLRYEHVVFAFLSRVLGRGPHVEDLAQEVFIRALRALPRFDVDGPARPTTWLLSIASRLAIDHRRKGRVTLVALDEKLAPAAPTTPESERRRAELGRALARAAAQLPADQLDVFVLAEFHGLEMRDIAEVLRIPEGTAKTRLFRAREKLRALLANVREET